MPTSIPPWWGEISSLLGTMVTTVCNKSIWVFVPGGISWWYPLSITRHNFQAVWWSEAHSSLALPWSLVRVASSTMERGALPWRTAGMPTDLQEGSGLWSPQPQRGSHVLHQLQVGMRRTTTWHCCLPQNHKKFRKIKTGYRGEGLSSRLWHFYMKKIAT